MADISDSYDRLAATYAARLLDELDHKPFDRARLRLLAQYAPVGLPVADVGCGTGQIGAFLADMGREVVGVDLSEGMLAEARRHFPAIRFLHGDLRALPVEDGSLAAITAFYCLIHLPRTDVTVALTDFRRALAPGGRVLAAVHHGTGEIHEERALDTDVPLWATLFGTAELAAYAEDAGLVIDKIEVRDPYEQEYPSRRLYLSARRPAEEPG